MGECSTTGLVTGIICLAILLGVTKCGVLGYCIHRMMGLRKRRSEEKEKVKKEFEDMRKELGSLSRQKKREGNNEMEHKMGINADH